MTERQEVSMGQPRHRVFEAPGYLLHASAWKETSLILQAFTRPHGTVVLVAKGAKRPQSTLRGALTLFQPVLLSWSGKHEIKTLARVEPDGILPLAGRAWMSAWYMNELLLRLVPREDAHDALFDAYDTALRQLAGLTQNPAQNPAQPVSGSAAAALRRFEWTLLAETGYRLASAPPDFDDPEQVQAIRAPLRERLDWLLSERPLNTRNVLMQLQRL